MQSDYCIGIDSEWVLDGAQRAQDTSSFSPCHINHSRTGYNVARRTLRKEKKVQLLAVHDIRHAAACLHPACEPALQSMCWQHRSKRVPTLHTLKHVSQWHDRTKLLPRCFGCALARMVCSPEEELLLHYGSKYWQGREELELP
jgi:hypothetical protein